MTEANIAGAVGRSTQPATADDGSVAAATEAPDTGTSIFDLAHDDPPIDAVAALRRISAETGRTPLQVAREFLQLATGPGRLSFGDYVGYRLFDDAFIGPADKTAFIGRRRNQELVMEINFRHEWVCMADDKVAGASFLGAYGLPVIPIKAIYAPASGRPTKGLLRDRNELRAFLSDPDQYPMFGKPVAGFQSLGSIGLLDVDVAAGLIVGSKATIPIDTFIDEIVTRFERGYLFQSLLTSHRDVRPAIGAALSTARILTGATEAGPRVVRAAWKLIGGTNVADNFWRSGNMLAKIDLDSGRVSRAITGNGFELKTVDDHPVSGVVLSDLVLPNWAAMKEVAIEGHKALRDVGLIGWDIGSTDDGPVIVEANVMPDLVLVQAASGEGLFNPELADFLTHRKKLAATHRRAMKATLVRV